MPLKGLVVPPKELIAVYPYVKGRFVHGDKGKPDLIVFTGDRLDAVHRENVKARRHKHNDILVHYSAFFPLMGWRQRRVLDNECIPGAAYAKPEWFLAGKRE